MNTCTQKATVATVTAAPCQETGRWIQPQGVNQGRGMGQASADRTRRAQSGATSGQQRGPWLVEQVVAGQELECQRQRHPERGRHHLGGMPEPGRSRPTARAEVVSNPDSAKRLPGIRTQSISAGVTMKRLTSRMYRRGTPSGAMLVVIGMLASVGRPLYGQTDAYPARPQPLPESQEIALALSAAPVEISAKATIYVLRATGPARAREGTNGCTCMVSRDLHRGSLYPICFDQEATRTAFQQELMELRLRFEGKSEAEVKRAVTAAYAAGTLRPPARTAVTYMMSPHQVLFSSPLPEGTRVGAWHPHLMIAVPYATGEQLGFGQKGNAGDFSLDRAGEAGAQLIVPVARWADSTKAAES